MNKICALKVCVMKVCELKVYELKVCVMKVYYMRVCELKVCNMKLKGEVPSWPYFTQITVLMNVHSTCIMAKQQDTDKKIT